MGCGGAAPGAAGKGALNFSTAAQRPATANRPITKNQAKRLTCTSLENPALSGRFHEQRPARSLNRPKVRKEGRTAARSTVRPHSATKHVMREKELRIALVCYG